jgi:hypothetical protein
MKVFHGARQAVELIDDDMIDLTPLEVQEEALELRSLQRAGGERGIFIGPDVISGLGFDIMEATLFVGDEGV